MSECEECQGLGFTQTGEDRTPCGCVARRRAKVYLRKMHPMAPVPQITKDLDTLETDKDILILAPDNFQDLLQVKWAFSYLLLKGGISRTYDLIGASEVALIKFGESERFSTLTRVKGEVLCLYYGYHEVRNAMLGDLMLSLLDIRAVKGLRNWILMRGRPEYADVVTSYAKGHRFQVLDLTGEHLPSSTSNGSKSAHGIKSSHRR